MKRCTQMSSKLSTNVFLFTSIYFFKKISKIMMKTSQLDEKCCLFENNVYQECKIEKKNPGNMKPFARETNKLRAMKMTILPKMMNLVCWGCRIYWLHLSRGVKLPKECPGYDTIPSGGEALVLALPGTLWLGVVVLLSVPSMNQTELFNHLTLLKRMAAT